MNARSWIVPGLVFFAGAVMGRLFGVKPLIRGAMTAASMAGMLPDTREPQPAHRVVRHRPARRRAARRTAHG